MKETKGQMLLSSKYTTRWYGEEPYCFCDSEESLKAFAEDGGWESVDSLLTDTGLEMDDFINHWFLIVNGRVFYHVD
jgi:hypothetical protein